MKFSAALPSLLISSLLLAGGCNRGDRPQGIAQVAPDFTVQNGTQTVRLDQYRGRIVILNFWATWCAPCIEELPGLEQLQRLRPDVQVLAVSIDDDPDAYAQFLKRYDMSLLSVRTGMSGVNLKYGTTRPPETYLIDRNGVIRRKFIGPQRWTNPEMLNYLQKI